MSSPAAPPTATPGADHLRDGRYSRSRAPPRTSWRRRAARLHPRHLPTADLPPRPQLRHRALVSRQAGGPGQPRSPPTPVGTIRPSPTTALVTFVTRAANLFDVQAARTLDAAGGEVVTATVDAGTLARTSLLGDGVSPAPLRAGCATHLGRRSHGRVPDVGGHGAQTSGARSRGVRSGGVRSRRPPDPAPAHVVITTHGPKVTVAPLDVGTVAVGAPSGTWFVSVSNEGPAPFVPATITTSNPDFAVIAGGTCQLGVAVPACGFVHRLRRAHAEHRRSEAGRVGGSPRAASAQRRPRRSCTVVAGSVPLAGLERGARLRLRARRFVLAGVHPAGGQLRPRRREPGRCQRGRDQSDRLHRDGHDVRRRPRGRRELHRGRRLHADARRSAGGQRAGGRRHGGVRGDGRRQRHDEYSSAALVLATDRVVAGGRLGVGGAGFPANTPITLSWSDGFGGTYTVTTNRSGGFLASVVLATNERPARARSSPAPWPARRPPPTCLVLPRSVSSGLPVGPG